MTTSKILWAVDPFDKSINSPAVEGLLREFSGTLHSEVIPTFVLSGPPLGDEKVGFQQEVDRKIGKLKLPQLSSAEILTSASSSVYAATEKLGKFAKSKKAKAILVPSHGRSGLSRLVLGSFAETLMLESRIPLIIVNPKTKVSGPIRHILVATDLAPASKKAFLEAYHLAKRLGARVTLYHAIPAPVYPMPVEGMSFMGAAASMPTPAETGRMAAISRRRAETWVGARKDVTIVIEKDVLSVADAISTCAKKVKAQLIAIEAQSHRLSATFVGSITRNVVRSATCPVWITRFRK
jgi:nucleotide-binding universal stress UspA family protein